MAVSGGADSVALLALLRSVGGSRRLRLNVAHLDHGLRPEGATDRRFVEQLAETWGLPLTAEVTDTRRYAQEQHLSVEAAAREVRYAFLERAARARGCPLVAAGHTADDQAETLLLRVLRGARPGGMWPRRRLGEVTLVRPLLGLWRRELRAWLQTQGLPWRDDPTNRDPRHLRNRVRHDLIPILAGYIPDVQNRLKHSADVLAAEDAALEAAAVSVEEMVIAGDGADGVRLRRARLRAQPLALRRRLLRRALARAGGNIRRLRFVHIEEALRLAEDGRTGDRADLPGIAFEVRGAELVVVGQAIPPTVEVLVPIEGRVEAEAFGVIVESAVVAPEAADFTDGAAYLDADRVRAPLTLRAWRPGDRFRPLGMRGKKKVGDFLTDAKTPRLLRARVPVVEAADGTILWVVGGRIAEDARVSAGTRRILRLRVAPRR